MATRLVSGGSRILQEILEWKRKILEAKGFPGTDLKWCREP